LDIIHRAGKNHSNYDTLSRWPCERGTTTDCPQCIRGTTVEVTVNTGHSDEHPHNSSPAQPESSSSSPTGSVETARGRIGTTETRSRVNSVLSPTATPFYPVNNSRRDIAESQESVSTLLTGQNSDVSRLQRSWSHVSDSEHSSYSASDHLIANLSNLLAVQPSGTILPHLCVLLNMLCLEMVGIHKAATESSIQTHWLANQMIQQQHLQMGVDVW